MTLWVALLCGYQEEAREPQDAARGVIVDQLRKQAPSPLAPVAEEEPEFPVRAWLEIQPPEVEIGEPILCELFIAHEQGVRLRTQALEFEPAASWIMIGEPRVASVDDSFGRLTRARWSVASLEPGEREIVAPTIRFDQGGALHSLLADPAEVRVRPALEEGEDAPRPAAGFRPPPTGGELSLRGLMIAVGAALAALIVTGFFLVRSRSRREPAEVDVTPRERIDRIGLEGLDDPARAREVYFELSSALRELVDRRQGADRRGATDDEWIAAAAGDDSLSHEAHEAVAGFIRRAESVKYGQESPTRWAVEESLTTARELSRSLSQENADRGRRS